jgi:hypothetical protein
LEAAVQLLEAILPALVGGEAFSGGGGGASGGGGAASAATPPPGGAAGAAGTGAGAALPAVAYPAVAEALRGMLQQLLGLRLRDPIMVMLVGGGLFHGGVVSLIYTRTYVGVLLFALRETGFHGGRAQRRQVDLGGVNSALIAPGLFPSKRLF